ncbi:MAG: restriction endonuclease [Colwellia sp.]|jgi:Restriction endonuclease
MPLDSIITYKDAFFTLDYSLWYLLALSLFICLFSRTGNNRHSRKIKSARKALNIFRSISEPAKKFSYIRKVNPFVFEEMILTSLKDSGCKITRNNRYTGDGGVDGRAVIRGTSVLIQAKRYRGHISANDITEFSILCGKSRKQGLFVHTGKTGKQAKLNSIDCRIDIVSGNRMIALLDGSYSGLWEHRGCINTR